VGYANPYYSAIPAAVVAASPYDYSQPVVVNNYITNDGDVTDASTTQGGTATNEQTVAPSAADAAFDAALAAFKKEDYAAALAGCDKAVKQSPDDSVIHEVRALSLFALGRYPEAAATLNSVLAVAPGMDWTTMSSLYDSVDAYTQQLRKLEEFCRSKPDNAAGHFVLAYHYLVGGHVDLAADALRVVVAKQPDDVVAKRLLDAIQPTSGEAEESSSRDDAQTIASDAATPAGPETDLVGRWTATSGKDSVELVITDDSRFTWKAAPAGRPPVTIDGTIETARDAIARLHACRESAHRPADRLPSPEKLTPLLGYTFRQRVAEDRPHHAVGDDRQRQAAFRGDHQRHAAVVFHTGEHRHALGLVHGLELRDLAPPRLGRQQCQFLFCGIEPEERGPFLVAEIGRADRAVFVNRDGRGDRAEPGVTGGRVAGLRQGRGERDQTEGQESGQGSCRTCCHSSHSIVLGNSVRSMRTPSVKS